MNKRLSCCLFFILSFSSLFALGTTDRQAIDQIVEHFTHAWNDCEGHGSADYYAEDADFVNIFGMAFAGKEEIESRHVQIHETFLKGSLFEVVETKVREAKPEVVIAQVYWKVSNIQKPVAETMNGIFTHTFVKNNGIWEIAATQNTLISPS
ncbi:MAG: SgcJ/EcaC family oxidoreductase [Verrucomicrobia bacterium]|nr:SgcJ/EcaC family oxidoreductase [Verrucomicrobiota bacterium]